VVYCQNLGGYTLETWRRAASATNAESAIEDRGAERRGVLGRGCRPPPPPQPTRGSGGASWALPAGSGRSPGRQRILGIFQGLRILLVETMHYGTNQKLGGAGQDLGGLCPPGPSLKPPLEPAPNYSTCIVTGRSCSDCIYCSCAEECSMYMYRQCRLIDLYSNEISSDSIVDNIVQLLNANR